MSNMFESTKGNMNHPSHGVHDPPIQKHSARPRGALHLATRSQTVRLVMLGDVLVAHHMAKDPMVVALVLTSLADHNFLLMVIASP